jgi:hypothetical protein
LPISPSHLLSSPLSQATAEERAAVLLCSSLPRLCMRGG